MTAQDCGARIRFQNGMRGSHPTQHKMGQALGSTIQAENSIPSAFRRFRASIVYCFMGFGGFASFRFA